MVYTDYKNLGMVVKEYHLKVLNEYFLSEIPFVPATEWLKEEIKFSFEKVLYRVSEIARCHANRYARLSGSQTNRL
jgi:hypothetical protein